MQAAAAACLVVAVAVFVLVAVVAPDDGATTASLSQGTALAALFAAPALAVLADGRDPSSVVARGGGMVVAGIATTPGGNLLGLVMAACGLLLMGAGGLRRPSFHGRGVALLVGHGIVLTVGVWLALGSTPATGLAAILLAVVVATGTRWHSPMSEGRRPAEERSRDLQD